MPYSEASSLWFCAAAFTYHSEMACNCTTKRFIVESGGKLVWAFTQHVKRVA